MKLQKFIEKTLDGIVSAIDAVNQKHPGRFAVGAVSGRDQTIDFDIAVKLTKSGGGEFDLTVLNLPLPKIGAKGKIEHESLNRIRFGIYVSNRKNK